MRLVLDVIRENDEAHRQTATEFHKSAPKGLAKGLTGKTVFNVPSRILAQMVLAAEVRLHTGAGIGKKPVSMTSPDRHGKQSHVLVAEVLVFDLADVALEVVALQVLVQLLVSVEPLPTELAHGVEVLARVGVLLAGWAAAAFTDVVAFQRSFREHFLLLDEERLVREAQLAELDAVVALQVLLELAQRVLGLFAALHPALELPQAAQLAVVRAAVHEDHVGRLVQHGLGARGVAPELEALEGTWRAAHHHALQRLLAHGAVVVVQEQPHAHGALAANAVVVALAHGVEPDGVCTEQTELWLLVLFTSRINCSRSGSCSILLARPLLPLGLGSWRWGLLFCCFSCCDWLISCWDFLLALTRPWASLACVLNGLFVGVGVGVGGAGGLGAATADGAGDHREGRC